MKGCGRLAAGGRGHGGGPVGQTRAPAGGPSGGSNSRRVNLPGGAPMRGSAREGQRRPPPVDGRLRASDAPPTASGGREIPGPFLSPGCLGRHPAAARADHPPLSRGGVPVTRVSAPPTPPSRPLPLADQEPARPVSKATVELYLRLIYPGDSVPQHTPVQSLGFLVACDSRAPLGTTHSLA